MDLTLQFPGLFEIEVQTRTLQTRKFKVRANSVMESFFISKKFLFRFLRFRLRISNQVTQCSFSSFHLKLQKIQASSYHFLFAFS